MSAVEEKNIKCMITTYDVDGVSGGDGEDVGAGDDAGARLLHRRLYVVDHFEATSRVPVWVRILLSREARRVVQKNRSITSLHLFYYIHPVIYIYYTSCFISRLNNVPLFGTKYRMSTS